jgi:hypothetical protein
MNHSCFELTLRNLNKQKVTDILNIDVKIWPSLNSRQEGVAVIVDANCAKGVITPMCMCRVTPQQQFDLLYGPRQLQRCTKDAFISAAADQASTLSGARILLWKEPCQSQGEDTAH